MTLNSFLAFMNAHGLLFLFAVVLLEYLNAPGLPAGLVFPAAGVWVAVSGSSFTLALAVSVAAGMLASMVLYWIGRLGGPRLLNRFRKKSPRLRLSIDRQVGRMRKNARVAVFAGRFIPVVRTIIGLPAGVIGMDVTNYVLFSALGIAIWNTALMLAGFWFGDVLFAQ